MLAVANAAPKIPCGSWDHYYQCDKRWGSQRLGTSPTNTICSAGCAMTSVAMMLYKLKTNLDGDIVYPPALNKWLNSHGGYVQHDLIVWDSVRKLGTVGLYGIYGTLTGGQVRSFIDNCWPIIIWVNNRSHWVLVKGYDTTNEDLLYINDPAGRSDTKLRSSVASFQVYQPLKHGLGVAVAPGMPEPNWTPELAALAQRAPDLLPEHMRFPPSNATARFAEN